MKLDVNVLRYLSKEDFRVLTSVEMGQKNVSSANRPRAAQLAAAACRLPPLSLLRSPPSCRTLALTSPILHHHHLHSTSSSPQSWSTASPASSEFHWRLAHSQSLFPLPTAPPVPDSTLLTTTPPPNHLLSPLPPRHGGAYRCLKTLLRHKLVHHEAKQYDGYRLTTLGYDFLAIRTLAARGHIASVGRQIGVGKESDIFEVRMGVSLWSGGCVAALGGRLAVAAVCRGRLLVTRTQQ
jgi:hypothetical protein